MPSQQSKNHEASAPQSSDDHEASLSDEYKEKRAAAKERLDNIRSIDGLVTVDGVGGVHIPKGSGRVSGRYMSDANIDSLVGNQLFEGHQSTVHDGLESRKHEFDLYNRSKDIVPFVEDIKQAVTDGMAGIMSGAETLASVMRAAMVKSKVFGNESALKVGNIADDDDIIKLFDYAYAEALSTADIVDDTSNHPLQPIDLSGLSTSTPTPQTSIENQPLTPVDLSGLSTPDPASQPAASNQPLTPIDLSGLPTSTPTAQPGIENQPLTPVDLSGLSSDADRLNQLDDLNGQLSLARSAWAKLSAKRQRHAFGRESSDYLAAEAEYQRLSREVARTELHDQLAAEPLLVKKYAMVDAHWINEQNKLREESKKSLEGRKIWKFADKFSKWLNRGPLALRVTKSAILGFAAAGVGLLTFGAGTAGAVGLALGARLGRGYATRVTGGIDQLDDETKADVSRRRSVLGTGAADDDILTSRANTYDAQYDADGDKLRKRRRGTILRAGALAVGGYVGGSLLHNLFGGGHNSISKGTSDGGNTGGNRGGNTGGNRGGNTGGNRGGNNGGGNVGAQPGGTTGDYAGSEVGEHVPASASDIPNSSMSDPTGMAPADPSDLDLGHGLLNPEATFNVHPGEGWYETFKDMGIPKDKWANVLKDAGPKLHKLGAAYFDQAHGEWRIAAPGTLKVDALRTIAGSSAKFGYAFSKIG